MIRSDQRQLTKTLSFNDGTTQCVVDPYELNNFQVDTLNKIDSIQESQNFLHRRLNDLQHINHFMEWIDQMHPELKREYVISQRVASRLDQGPGEVCVEAG
jgi:hypothetical protein